MACDLPYWLPPMRSAKRLCRYDSDIVGEGPRLASRRDWASPQTLRLSQCRCGCKLIDSQHPEKPLPRRAQRIRGSDELSPGDDVRRQVDPRVREISLVLQAVGLGRNRWPFQHHKPVGDRYLGELKRRQYVGGAGSEIGHEIHRVGIAVGKPALADVLHLRPEGDGGLRGNAVRGEQADGLAVLVEFEGGVQVAIGAQTVEIRLLSGPNRRKAAPRDERVGGDAPL